MKRNNNNKSRRGQKPRAMGLASHPPQINGLEPRHSTTLRFVTKAAINQAITFQNLLDTVLTANTAVAGTDLFETVKIRRVRVWSLPAVGGASSVSVEFNGLVAGVTGDQALHTDTSMGIEPAHVDARPSAKALSSNFQISSANAAFFLTCPTGSVVDVELSFRGAFAKGAPVAAANALVAATVGAQYLRGLDGLAVAGSNFTCEYGVGQI